MLNVFKKISQYIFFLGLGLFLLWYTTRSLTAEELVQLKLTLGESRFILIIPGTLLMLAANWSRAVRWKILMEPLGYRPRTINAFLAVMLGAFFNLLVPRLGEVMKCSLLARYEKTPVDKLIGTMVAERTIDFLCLVIIIILTILMQVDTLGEYARAELTRIFLSEGRFAWAKFFWTLIVITTIILGVRWLLMKYAHVGIFGRINSLIKGVMQGLTSVGSIRKKKLFLMHTILIWTVYLMCVRVGFLALAPVSHLGYKASFTILTFGSLGMIATQGGIGAYQLAVQKSLTFYGISAVNGLAYGWLLWAFQTILVLVTGPICLILMPLLNRKPHDAHQENNGEDIRQG
jgi:hypothetical protein